MENKDFLKLGEFNYDDFNKRIVTLEKQVIDMNVSLGIIETLIKELKEKGES